MVVYGLERNPTTAHKNNKLRNIVRLEAISLCEEIKLTLDCPTKQQ